MNTNHPDRTRLVQQASGLSHHHANATGRKPVVESIHHHSAPAISATVLTALLCVTSAANAEEHSLSTNFGAVDATVSASSSSVQVAEPLTFELMVTAPAGTKIILPAVPERLGEFEVVDHHDIPDVPSATDTKIRIRRRRLTLESIVTGDLTIPSLSMQVVADGEMQTVETKSLPVQVLSVLEDRADPTQFRDIKSVADVEVPQLVSHTWVWWTLTGIGTSALALLALVAIAKRKAWITPDIWAVRELNQLRGSEALTAGDSETVIQDLTTTVRDFLELQFEISAPVKTTDELIHLVQIGNHVAPETADGFRDLFGMADQARFAGLQLSPSELTDIIDDAQRLIKQAANDITMQTTQTREDR